MSLAKDRDRGEDVTPNEDKSLLESEYGDIIDLCRRFKDLSPKSHRMGEDVVAERNKIFGILVATAKRREDLPSLKEYYTMDCPACDGEGCTFCRGMGIVMQRIGKYKGTITEMNAVEWVSALHQKVIELKNSKITPPYLKDRNGEEDVTTKGGK